MSERTTDYHWRAIAEDVAVGYARDPLGKAWVLMGVVIYAPSTAKLRALHLRELEKTTSRDAWPITQEPPPTAEQVATAWTQKQAIVAYVEENRQRDDFGIAIAQGLNSGALRVEELSRRPGEAPDDFYRRVARAHEVITTSGSRMPVIPALADAAGVPTGTAAAWVSRAKARGLIGEDEGQ